MHRLGYCWHKAQFDKLPGPRHRSSVKRFRHISRVLLSSLQWEGGFLGGGCILHRIHRFSQHQDYNCGLDGCDMFRLIVDCERTTLRQLLRSPVSILLHLFCVFHIAQPAQPPKKKMRQTKRETQEQNATNHWPQAFALSACRIGNAEECPDTPLLRPTRPRNDGLPVEK